MFCTPALFATLAYAGIKAGEDRMPDRVRQCGATLPS